MTLSTSDIDRLVSEEVPKEYEKLLSEKGRPDFTLSSIWTDYVESSGMKNFLAGFREKEIKIYAWWLIEQFQNSLENGDYTKIYQQLDDITTLFQKLQRQQNSDIIA